jgi:hypothetical protein
MKDEFFKIEGSHNIKQLCDTFISKWTKYMKDSTNIDENSPDSEQLKKELQFVGKFIKLLYENTEDMSSLRYPLTSKKGLQFYNEATENVTVNLDCFKIWVSKIYSILSSIASFIEQGVEHYEEALAEYKSSMIF